MNTNNGTSISTVRNTNGKRYKSKRISHAVWLRAVGFTAGFLFLSTMVKSLPTQIQEPVIHVQETETPAEKLVPLSVLAKTDFIETEEENPLPYYYPCPLSHEMQDYIREKCEHENVPMSLVIAMIDAESSFRSDVISSTNDYGYMQINTYNFDWLHEQFGISDFLDPYQNCVCGIYIIGGCLKATNGNLELALMQYNCGEPRAKELWDEGIYSTEYTRNIMSKYLEYENAALEAGTSQTAR